MIEEMMINSFGPGLVSPRYYDWTKNQENKLFKKREASGLWVVARGAFTT